MKVWVVAPNDYDLYGIDGIYDSLEAAKASRPDVEWKEHDDGWIGPNLLVYEDRVRTLADALGQ